MAFAGIWAPTGPGRMLSQSRPCHPALLPGSLNPRRSSPPDSEPPPGSTMKSGILLLLLAAPLLLWAKPTPATEKAGYCSRQLPLGGVFDEEPCSACLKDQSCSNCSSDADCPGEAKCCPGDCGFTCQAPVKDFCHLPSVCGSCKALFVRFFYNSSTRACEEFVYGGCGGNKNNFETKEDCSKACQHLDTA